MKEDFLDRIISELSVFDWKSRVDKRQAKKIIKMLETIEELMEVFEIKDLFELRRALRRYKDTNYVRHTKNKALEREVLSLIASGHTRIFRRPPNHFYPYSDPCVEVRIIIEHDVENRNPEVLEWFKEKARHDEKQLLKDLMEMKQ